MTQLICTFERKKYEKVQDPVIKNRSGRINGNH